jgi:hypothetical protein
VKDRGRVSAEPVARFKGGCRLASNTQLSQVASLQSQSLDETADHLDPHSYPACALHAPDEHLLAPLARQALRLMAGLFWDLGDYPG